MQGKLEPGAGTIIEIGTGKGGMAMVQNWMRNLPSDNGMVLQADPYIQNLGKNNNQDLVFAGPEYTGFVMRNGMGVIKFKYIPALDPHDANDVVNPVVPLSKAIGGHRLSSYMFILDDITNTDSDNICELMYGPDWDTRKSVLVGKLPYMGNMTLGGGAWQRSSNHPGYEVMFEKRHKAYFVKDVTKSLLIKPINPFTGVPIYDPFFGNAQDRLKFADV